MEKLKTVFVIFSEPKPQAGPETRYIAHDGKTETQHRREAAYFFTISDAKQFAKQHGITLDAMTYIGSEDFTERDLMPRS